MLVKTMGASAVPTASIFAPGSMTSSPTAGDLVPLMVVPASMVSVAPAFTCTGPFKIHVRSLVRVWLSTRSPDSSAVMGAPPWFCPPWFCPPWFCPPCALVLCVLLPPQARASELVSAPSTPRPTIVFESFMM
jgi:hypothetical protein